MPKYIYYAMLHQSGTSGPVTVTVLENTFPNEPLWEHVGQGTLLRDISMMEC
jgi:hypothetical protein